MAEDLDEDDNRNTCLNSIKTYNQEQLIKRIYQQVLQVVLFIFALDPFAIYKPFAYRERDALKYQIYQTNALKIEPNNRDKWLSRWRRMLGLTNAYICMKFSAIVLAQVASNNCQSTTGASGRFCLCGPALELWLKILGNPAIALQGATIFIYSLIVVILVYVLFYMFLYHYTLKPADSEVLRLWLEPEREFKRIDLSIMQMLEDLAQPIERTCYCSRRGVYKRKYASMRFDHDLVASREIQAQVIGMFRSGFWYLRPIIYTSDWYRTFNRFVLNISLPIYVIIIAFAAVGMQPLLSFILTDGVSRELQWAHLSSYQMLTSLETIMSIILIGTMGIFQLVVFISLCYSQLMLLNDIKHQLMVCLDKLRRMNCGQTVVGDNLAGIYILLGPLIKISLSIKELRNNVIFLTEMVSINVVVSSSACILIQLAGYLDGEHLADFRSVIIMFHWLWANRILTSCAHIYTRATKLEQIIWSIMAELRSREVRGDLLLFEFQVTGNWRRLISSRCFSDSLMSVKPFGIIFNYYRALQINYLAISFAILLKSL